MGAGLELEARRRDGSTFPVEISLTLLSTGTGNMVIATVRNITERKAFDQVRSEVTHFREVARIVSLHRDLTTVASLGAGVSGIAQALERVTNYAVAIEDPDGTVLAHTEPLKPESVLPPGPQRRRLLSAAGHAEAFRHGPRLIAVARPER
jgi:hypothetical protein